jgi:hypothetical protein
MTKTVDIKELLKRDTKSVNVTEKNKPNLDRMAEAFYKLLIKR